MGGLKDAWRRKRPEIACGILYFFFRLIGMTLRTRVEGTLPEGGVLISGFHGRSYVFANELRRQGVWVLVSQSRDGEMQARIFERLGFRLIRGSTGRGGIKALVEAIRVLRNGDTMAMTPDGPRGPAGVVSPGIITMAHKSGATLVPTGVATARRWRVKSWDRYVVPKPFSRALILYGPGIRVPADADEATLERCRQELEIAMRETEAEADRRVGVEPDWPGEAA